MQAGKQGHRSQLRTRDRKGSGSRVSRKGLRQAVLTALDEDGLVCLLSDHGYGLYSLGRDLARHLRFQKNSVQVLEFQTVSKEKLIPILKKIEEMTGSDESCKAGDKGDKSGKGDARKSRANAKTTAAAKGARGKRGETADARPYHFFLDFPALEEDEALSVLPVFKKILKKAKVCMMGAPRLDLFNDYLPKHKTFCARDFLVSKSEEASWALSDEEPFLHFLEETKGVLALAEARYLKAGRKHAAKDGQGAQSTKEMMCAIAQGLVEKAMVSALLREEKELLAAMILLRHGTRADLERCGVKPSPETLAEIQRDAPIFGISEGGASFALPSSYSFSDAMARRCIKKFEKCFFGVVCYLFGEERFAEASGILELVAEEKEVQAFVLEHAFELYEGGAAGLLLEMKVQVEKDKGERAQREEKEGGAPKKPEALKLQKAFLQDAFLKIARTLSCQRTRNWSFSLSELLGKRNGVSSTEEGDTKEGLFEQKIALLLQVSEMYRSLDATESNSKKALLDYDATYPAPLRSLSSFLYIRRAFLQNRLTEAAARAGVSKFDCNQKSVSGSLLTLAVFETQLVQTAHENVPQKIGQEEALDALRFLKHPGYEVIYAYEKLFLQLLSRLTDPSALISDAEETLRFALQKNDALAAATSFCAGSFNGIFSADFEKSVAFATEAEKLAGKQQMVLLEQLAVIFQEGASSEVGHLRKRKGDDGALKWVGEAEGEALDAEASDGAEDSVTLDAPRMLHLILINIKKKLDYQRKHKSARRRSEKEKRKVETGLEADAAASADAPDIPSFVSASSVLGPLWEGVVLLVMEKNETLGDELWRELPAQWKNSLLEHSKESAHAGENVGQSFKGAPPQIFSASRQLHDAQDAQGTQGAQDVQDVQDVRGSLLSRRESLKADAMRKDVVSHERRALRHENILSISLLNNFSVRLSGRSVPESAWRRESAKNLLLLLAATPNHTLTKSFILKQLWPGLSPSTSKSLDNNFYTALSDLRKALLTEEALRRKDVPFLTYVRGNLGLVMEKVEVDMDEFYFSTKRACSVNSSDAVKREEALRVLSLFGTGPKFPQAFSRLEEAHLIKSRLTREFSEAAIEGALAAFRQDFVRDATRLSLAAVAASPLQQEIAEDAMNMLLEVGKTEEARKVYKVFSHSYKKTFGHVPEGEIQKLAARLPAFAPEKPVFQKRPEEVAPPRMSLVA